uniref:growth/differentiation factor 7-like n=1 Tax=Panthera onca TaxID=9690 RepID=UPI0029546BB9|nr:growth/differentiation factor 7-like [Panthera onca]
MDLSAAAALCLWLLSACRPRDGLEAAAVLRAAGAGPVGSPGGDGGSGSGGRTLAPAAGVSAAPAAAAPGVRAARRAAGSGFRNGSVVPHQFMMSLYRNLAGRAPAGAAAASTSGSGRHGRADTITGFADQANQGTHASSAPVHPVRS